jgi:hypothetical protein
MIKLASIHLTNIAVAVLSYYFAWHHEAWLLAGSGVICCVLTIAAKELKP